MGIWARPKTGSDINRANESIKLLTAFKVLIYPIVGDDDLFDYIDAAIIRIRELTPKN